MRHHRREVEAVGAREVNSRVEDQREDKEEEEEEEGGGWEVVGDVQAR